MKKGLIEADQENQDVPLPLLVAERWDFSLAHHEIDGETWYAVQDWIKGLITASADKAKETWANMQRQNSIEGMFLKQPLPYVATDGKTYQRDFTTDKGLYLIAQNLRSTKDRPLLKEIKTYLAASGVFVDEARRDPEQLLETLANDNPDAAMNAAIEGYKRQGKSMEWIKMRISGKVSRNKFTAALKAAVAEITQEHYRIASDDVYKGLWTRTAANLREELNISPNKSLRDGQPMLALYYQGITEEMIAIRLGERQTLSWKEARNIVQVVASMIGNQARQASEFLGIDFATGKPLLRS